MPQNAILFSGDGEKLRRAGKSVAAFERPFDVDEVLSAVGKALNASSVTENIRYDKNNRILYGTRGSVRLSEKEADLFNLLLSRKVLDRAAAAALFANGEAESNIVDVYIHYLRKKLRRISPCELLTATRGKGYTLCTAFFSVI